MIILRKRNTQLATGNSKALREHWPEVLVLFPALAILIGTCYQSTYYSRLNVPISLSQLSLEGNLLFGSVTLVSVAILVCCIPSFLLLAELLREMDWFRRMTSRFREGFLRETNKKQNFYRLALIFVGAGVIALGVLSWTRIGSRFGDDQANKFLSGQCPYVHIEISQPSPIIKACLVTTTENGEWVIPVNDQLTLSEPAQFVPKSSVSSIRVLGTLADIRNRPAETANTTAVSASIALNGEK